MDSRLLLAIATSRGVGAISRRLGVGGGTTVPGRIALRLDPAAPRKVAQRLMHGSVLVTGTNGKTTTARMISTIFQASGWHPVHNRAGANLLSGVTSALLGAFSLAGTTRADAGLFEVDEAMMPAVLRQIQPRVLVVTNLFRDQLDRYGEVEYLSRLWRQALTQMPEPPILVLNADDPQVAFLGRAVSSPTVYFGLEDRSWGELGAQHTADTRYCSNCDQPLLYELSFFGHVGIYACQHCGWRRPDPDVKGSQIAMQGTRGTEITVQTPTEEISLSLSIPGLYNVYNALAALACARALGLDFEVTANSLATFDAAFGRLETVRIGDKQLLLTLVKNPVGFNEVLRMLLSAEGELDALIAINDNFADGTDISWLWDVDFERLAGRIRSLVVSGTRADDMAVRLKYAGLDASRVRVCGNLREGLTVALQGTPSGGTLCVAPTYTAMLEIRAVLHQSGLVKRFWQD